MHSECVRIRMFACPHLRNRLDPHIYASLQSFQCEHSRISEFAHFRTPRDFRNRISISELVCVSGIVCACISARIFASSHLRIPGLDGRTFKAFSCLGEKQNKNERNIPRTREKSRLSSHQSSGRSRHLAHEHISRNFFSIYPRPGH